MSLKSCEVYSQYLNTNIDRFITGLCGISKYYNQITQATLNNYLDLHTSSGEALDTMGRLLNFNRYIVFNDPLDVVIAKTPGIDEYEVLHGDFKKCRLNDDSYRKVLTIILQTRNTVASVSSLTKIISEAVNAEIFVGDAMDMKYITYYFLDLIPGWLEVSMHNYDILPRPAGMAVQYISAVTRLFGFLIDKPQVNEEETVKIFTSFWKSRFPDNILGITHYPTERLIEDKSIYIPQNLTLEDINNLNIKEAPLKEEQLASFLRFYDEQKVVDEHSKRDALIIPKIKKWIGTSFRQYADQLDTYSDGVSALERRMYIPMLTQVKAIKKRYMLDTLKNLNHQIVEAKEDPRINLYYDRSSGWYFYKAPNSKGQFDPEYQANLYQDDCGLWYPQDPFELQLERKKITLRHPNYANNQRTKDLPDPVTSPFFAKYLSLYNNFDQIETSTIASDDYGNLRKIIEEVHTAVKIWHQANLINERSFKAVLEFEYRNASMVQYRNYLRDKGKYREHPSEGRHDQLYWKYIYEDLDNYYGSCRSYDDTWNDRDTNAPVYKRKMFLKYQRYLVMNAKDKLMEVYSRAQRWKGAMSSNHIDSSTVDRLVSKIAEMQQDLSKDFYDDYHLSKYYGARMDSGSGWDWYNQTNRRNQELYDDANWNGPRESRLNSAASSYDQAASACAELKNKCNRGESIRGQHWLGWYCFLKDGLEDGVDYGRSSGDSNISWNAKSYWTDNNRSCGYESVSDFDRRWASNKAHQMEDHQKSNARDARWKAQEAKKKYGQATREKQIRTIVTKDRTLRDIINHYNSYVPSSLVPKPDGPIIEYPEWSIPPDEYIEVYTRS